MRAVNLLPERHRPRAATGKRAGSAYAVVAVLGVLLVAVLAYALTANKVNSLKEDTIRVEREAADAEARAAELAPFAAFQQVKETRVTSVGTLARSRIDWERLARELARVLPPEASLTKVEASTTPEEATSTVSAGQEEPPGPTVSLSGCAKSQPVVARMLVRLKRLNGAEDVKLDDSSKAAQDAAAGDVGSPTGAAAGTSGDASATAGADCDEYIFEATVELTPATPLAPSGAGSLAGGEEVPTSLGGGP